MIGPGDQWLELCEGGFHNSVIPGLVPRFDGAAGYSNRYSTTTQTDCLSNLIIVDFYS